jgi:hypothetical protein
MITEKMIFNTSSGNSFAILLLIILMKINPIIPPIVVPIDKYKPFLKFKFPL